MAQFLIDHHAVILSCVAGVTVAVLDLIFALNKSAESNGVLHWLYVFAKGRKPDSQATEQPKEPS